MMHEANLLSVAFLEEHPKAAAALLQEFSPEQAVAFFQQIPVDTLVPVIDNMSGWPAARILSQMPERLAAEILGDLPAIEAESLLRIMGGKPRDLILGHMDRSLAKNFTKKLTYPVGAVGAWMDTSITYFTTDSIVNDCLDLIKRQKSQLNGIVIVVDKRRKIVGIVKVEKLLISEHDEKLINLIDKEITPIPARATLSEVKDNQGWTKYPTLPVVDRNKVLLGTLAHHALQVGPTKSTAVLSNRHTFSLTAHMGNAFFIAMAGFLRLISTRSPDGPANASSPQEAPMQKPKELTNET